MEKTERRLVGWKENCTFLKEIMRLFVPHLGKLGVFNSFIENGYGKKKNTMKRDLLCRMVVGNKVPFFILSQNLSESILHLSVIPHFELKQRVAL